MLPLCCIKCVLNTYLRKDRPREYRRNETLANKRRFAVFKKQQNVDSGTLDLFMCSLLFYKATPFSFHMKHLHTLVSEHLLPDLLLKKYVGITVLHLSVHVCLRVIRLLWQQHSTAYWYRNIKATVDNICVP